MPTAPSTPPSRRGRRRTLAGVVLAAALLLLAGCAAVDGSSTAATGGPAGVTEPPQAGVPAGTPDPTEASSTEPSGTVTGIPVPSDHVHGIGVNPADGRVVLATHDGLLRYDAEGPVAIGPVIDLMGFTVAGPDHFYASGHPGPGVDLPNPVGLIESTDGGATWTPVSRQGRTDFHALAASAAGVVGFDGASLLASPDGLTWTELRVPVPVHAVAASPDGTTLVVTSEAGLTRSADAGATWSTDHAAPLLQLVQFADARTAVGIAPDGAVHVSDDAGATWSAHGQAGPAPQAIAATRAPDGALEVTVVTGAGILRSGGGEPFGALPGG